MTTKFLIPLIAGLGMLCACKSRNNAETTDSTKLTTSVKKNTDSLYVGSKLIKTANMHFKVKNVQQTSNDITSLTKKFNGIVVHHLITSAAGKSIDIRKTNDSLTRVSILNTTAEMTVKIPPVYLENFMSDVSRLGIYINNSKMEITDKSFDYLSTRMKLKNQGDLVINQKSSDISKKSPDELLSFKNNMVDQTIQNRRIDDSVKTSTITLCFYESNVVSRETIANDDLSAYNLPFFKRLSISIENGWTAFEDIFIAIANFWILIPVALGIWFTVKLNKRRIPIKS